jgi:uncharacterized protein DUF4440
MSISRAFIAPVVTALCVVVASGDAAQPNSAAAEAELRRITQEMMDAIAPGHAEVWDRYLDERLIHVDENGTVRGKRELLAELRPLPPGLTGRIAVDRFRIEQHGETAVVAYEIQEHLDYHGQILRSRFRTSDTWLKTRGGWKLIGSQTAAVLKDPPEVALTRAQLCNYNGTYALTDGITTTIGCSGSGLTSERTDRAPATYRAETSDVFFVPGEPRTRRIFQRDADGNVRGFVDRREGEDILWRRVPAAQSP